MVSLFAQLAMTRIKGFTQFLFHKFINDQIRSQTTIEEAVNLASDGSCIRVTDVVIDKVIWMNVEVDMKAMRIAELGCVADV